MFCTFKIWTKIWIWTTKYQDFDSVNDNYLLNEIQWTRFIKHWTRTSLHFLLHRRQLAKLSRKYPRQGKKLTRENTFEKKAKPFVLATRRHCEHIRKFKSSGERKQQHQEKQISNKNAFFPFFSSVPSLLPCRQRGGGRGRRAPEGGDCSDKVAVGQRGLAVVGLQDPDKKTQRKMQMVSSKNALKTFQIVDHVKPFNFIRRCSCKPRNGRDSI